MEAKSRLFVPPFVPLRSLLIAATMAGSALVMLPCTQTPAAAWGRTLNPQPLPPGRALNPQPLPPGLYSPNHPGPTVTPLYTHPTSRRVCVAWGRVCVKAGQGTRTHPAPCEQFEYVCKKYG